MYLVIFHHCRCRQSKDSRKEGLPLKTPNSPGHTIEITVHAKECVLMILSDSITAFQFLGRNGKELILLSGQCLAPSEPFQRAF